TNSFGTGSATVGPTVGNAKAAVATGCPPGNGPVAVADVTAPARLNIARAKFSPSPVRRSTRTVVATIHVANTCNQSVKGALVGVTAVPSGQFRVPAEKATDADGNVTLRMSRLNGFPYASGQRLLALYVHARKPGEPANAGIST